MGSCADLPLAFVSGRAPSEIPRPFGTAVLLPCGGAAWSGSPLVGIGESLRGYYDGR